MPREIERLRSLRALGVITAVRAVVNPAHIETALPRGSGSMAAEAAVDHAPSL